MTRTHRARAARGTLLLSALLLAGCTGQGPDTAPSNTPTPSNESTATRNPATPAPQAVTVAPQPPAEIEDDGPRGAEAAAVYFLTLEPHMQMSGETSAWDAMSDEACDFCAARRDQAHRISENGDRFDGGIVSATVSHTYAQDSATGVWPLDLDVVRQSTTITAADGTVVFEEAAGTDQLRLEVTRRDQRWVVLNVALRPAS